MFRALFHKVDLWLVRSVKSKGDDQETLLRKKIWWGLTLCWVFFFSYDFIISLRIQSQEMILLNAAGLLICISLLLAFYFHRKNTEGYGLILQVMMVILPSLKIFFLGGVFNATGIVFAGLIGPIYALTFPNYRRAALIFFFYLALILGGTLYKQWLLNPELLHEPAFRYSLYRFTGGICVIFFISMIYSVQLAKLKGIEEERLIQLHHAKSKLYTNITHEFRTPLTVILGMAEGIEDDPKFFLKKGSGLIISNANKLLKLVNHLLSLSKMEADAMPVNLIQSDIIPFLKYLLESFHSFAEEKNIRLHFLSDIEELTIDYDQEIIEEIISNLISNAVKYTPCGGDVYLQIETKPEIKGKSGEELVIRIRDNGIGITEDDLPHIFNRFYQVDDENTRKAGGTGIGLALVKEYVQLIQGSILVKSQIGKGSEFFLRLPVSRESRIQTMDYKSRKNESYPPTTDTTLESISFSVEDIPNPTDGLPILLIIEDNDDVVEYLKTLLQLNYHIEVAHDGDQGISLAFRSIPDIIICDVMMPEKDGYEVCKTLKGNFRTNHVPIILLTAKADMESKIDGLEYGADAYISKPFDKRELLVRIGKLIESRKKLKEKYSDVFSSHSDDKKPKGLNEIFLHNLFENLGKNYHDEFYGIDQLCGDAGISRTQMHRKLIALSGKKTSDFIRHYRIKKAKEFLLNSGASISEIAYQVGFKDPNYFTKSFVKEMGITPSQFRSEHTLVKQ